MDLNTLDSGPFITAKVMNIDTIVWLDNGHIQLSIVWLQPFVTADSQLAKIRALVYLGLVIHIGLC